MADVFFTLDINLETINHIEFQLPEHNPVVEHDYFKPKIIFQYNETFEQTWSPGDPIDSLTFGLIYMMFINFTFGRYVDKIEFYRIIIPYDIVWEMSVRKSIVEIITFISKNANPPFHTISKMKSTVEKKVNVKYLYNIPYDVTFHTKT
jgi:hypothetical protein